MIDPTVLAEATQYNKSFSLALPGLQTAIDSTSLGTFKECPRKYFYSIIMGYQPRETSVHLIFGLLLHRASEQYHHARAKGAPHGEALRTTVKWAMCATWDRAAGRPWTSGDNYKNRSTLIRTIVWYLDTYGENDALETITLASGKPAVELSFTFSLGTRSVETDEEFMLCGHLDRLARMGSETYIVDIKSSKSSIDGGWFAKFSPDNQFSCYTIAGRVVYGLPIQNLIVDGCQILVGSSRFTRGIVNRTPAQCDEWLHATAWWTRQMESCALAGEWPQNDKSCGLYGGCPFRGVCAKSPASRQQWLDADFTRRVWDPLERRGDI